ncbi:MAG: clostripain-related cysteine peptidase [Clostridia bacterium]|nr:clostripain-related cysteine peptidase [Clostridia bacterium]
MICKNCGNEIPDGSSCCQFCNAMVENNVSAQNYADPSLVGATSKPKGKAKKGVLAVVASILAIAVIGCGSVVAINKFQNNSKLSDSKQHSKADKDDDKKKDEDEDDDKDYDLTLSMDDKIPHATKDTEETSAPDETTEPVSQPAVSEVSTVDVPEGAASWTVLVYMDGSNLESGSGIGSYVMSRMDDMVSTDNVNVIVQTGGTSNWLNDEDSYFANDAVSSVNIPSDALGRYQIKNSEVIDLGSAPLASMGDASTLSDFITYGKENFPAQKYMLVLWDHGYVEPYGNLESDDIFYQDDFGNVYYYKDIPADAYVTNDCITLDELGKALNDGSVHFEVLTFNTCLSSSIEIASIVAPYANYMVASEESIPAMVGIPEEYITYLNQNPNCTGADVGSFICQAYSQALNAIINQTNYDEQGGGMFSKSTMAVINLSSIPQMQDYYDEVMKHVYYSIYDMETYTGFLNAASKCENYGSEGNVEGNLVDLKSFLVKAAPYLSDTDADEKLVELIDNNILAMNGPARMNSYGLSFFFPSYNYINNVKAVVEGQLVAAGYSYTQDQLDQIVGAVVSDSLNGYIDNIDNNGEYFWYAKYLDYRFEGYWKAPDAVYDLVNNYVDDDHKDDVVIDSNGYTIKYDTKLDTDGKFHLDISEGAEAVVSVEMNFILEVDNEDKQSEDAFDSIYTYFGATERGVVGDYANGSFFNALVCEWYFFGQYPVPVYQIESSDNQTIYGFRATVNGEDVVICFAHNKVADDCRILYACRLDENEGVASNDLFYLQDGDIIEVLFFTYAVGGVLDDYLLIRPFYTVEYEADMNIKISRTYGSTTTASYLMNYTITDAFGNVYYTDFVKYTVVNGVMVSAEEVFDVPEAVCAELYELV